MLLFTHGDIAQLVEHLVRNQRVTGSNPAISTFFWAHFCKNLAKTKLSVATASYAPPVLRTRLAATPIFCAFTVFP